MQSDRSLVPRRSDLLGPDGEQVVFRWFADQALNLDDYYCLVYRCKFGGPMIGYYPIRMWAGNREHLMFNASDVCMALGYDSGQPANWAKRNKDDFKPSRAIVWPGGLTNIPDTRRKATTSQHPGISIDLDGIAFVLNEARRRQASLERVTDFRKFLATALNVPESQLIFTGSDTAVVAVRCVEGKTLDVIRKATSWAESETQVTMVCGNKRYRVDCYYPHQKLVIECDESQHTTAEHQQADLERANALSTEMGLKVLAYRPYNPQFDLHEFIGFVSHYLVLRSASFNLPLKTLGEPKPIVGVVVYAEGRSTTLAPLQSAAAAASALDEQSYEQFFPRGGTERKVN